MDFKEAHEAFIQFHIDKRTGERRNRLERGHLHSEKQFLSQIWWKLYGNFDYLHPEYEVLDWRGVPYFIDLAYIRPFVKIGWEMKGFGPHVRDSDRTKFSNELNREAFLTALGWRIISFSYDDINDRPQVVQMLVSMNISQYTAAQPPVSMPLLADNEIIRLALCLARPIRPIDVVRHFACDHRTAVRRLHSLCEKRWLQPINHGSRIVQYELAKDILRYWS